MKLTVKDKYETYLNEVKKQTKTPIADHTKELAKSVFYTSYSMALIHVLNIVKEDGATAPKKIIELMKEIQEFHKTKEKKDEN